MKPDDPNRPPPPTLEIHTDAALEARIVAWALGEASAFEAAELERLAAEKPELAVFRRRILAVHGLVREAARPDARPLLLSPDRRAKLLATLGARPTALPPKHGAATPSSRKARRRVWLRAPTLIEALAACLVIGFIASIVFPTVGAVQMNVRRSADRQRFAAESEGMGSRADSLPPTSSPIAATPPPAPRGGRGGGGFGGAGGGPGGAVGGRGGGGFAPTRGGAGGGAVAGRGAPAARPAPAPTDEVQASQNALAALQLALGQLQKSEGNNQRVTAPAEFADGSPLVSNGATALPGLPSSSYSSQFLAGVGGTSGSVANTAARDRIQDAQRNGVETVPGFGDAPYRLGGGGGTITLAGAGTDNSTGGTPNNLPQVRIETVITDVALADQFDSGSSALGLEMRNDRLVGANGAANQSGGAATGGTDSRAGLIPRGVTSTDRTVSNSWNIGGGSPALAVTGSLASNPDPNFIKGGAGTLFITGINTFTGPTFVAGGTTVADRTLVLGGVGKDDTITKNGAGVWTLSGNNYYTGGTTINGGTLSTGGATTLNVRAGGQAGARDLDSAFAGMTGGTLSKSGTGTVTLSGSNSFTGGTVVSGGALLLGSSQALGDTGSVAITKSGSGTLVLTGANSSTFSGGVTLAGNRAISVSSVVPFTNSGAITGLGGARGQGGQGGTQGFRDTETYYSVSDGQAASSGNFGFITSPVTVPAGGNVGYAVPPTTTPGLAGARGQGGRGGAASNDFSTSFGFTADARANAIVAVGTAADAAILGGNATVAGTNWGTYAQSDQNTPVSGVPSGLRRQPDGLTVNSLRFAENGANVQPGSGATVATGGVLVNPNIQERPYITFANVAAVGGAANQTPGDKAEDTAQLVAQGVAQYNAGDLEGAQKAFRDVAAANSQSPEARYFLQQIDRQMTVAATNARESMATSMLRAVTEAWSPPSGNVPPPASPPTFPGTADYASSPAGANQTLNQGEILQAVRDAWAPVGTTSSASLASAVKQVSIESKFLEVTTGELREAGTNLTQSRSGTAGNGSASDSSQSFSFVPDTRSHVFIAPGTEADRRQLSTQQALGDLASSDRRDYVVLDEGVKAKANLQDLPTQQALAELSRAQSDTPRAPSEAEKEKAAKQQKLALLKLATVDEARADQQPDSTFALHVGDASYKVAQAALARGERPDPTGVRPEEFYNAFDYGDPAPAAGEPVGARVEQAAHPFLQAHNLVRVSVRVPAAGRSAAQPLRLTVLLDTSGSMEREDRAATVRAAMVALASLLGPADRVTLIGFARTPRLLGVDLPGNEAAKLVDLALRTPAEGGTNLEEALKAAAELATKSFLATAQNRVVLMTDGAANLGDADPERLAAQVAALREQKIAFDACGVGTAGLDDAVLEALTRKGGGRYYVLARPEEADARFARKLAGAFRPAAENVKAQVIFNPARVGGWRLVGFEQHRLNKEDFRNDAVDGAATIAAEEAAVALYQVEVKADGEGDLGEVAVRFRDAATGQMVERTWPLLHDARAPAFDRAPPTLRLAGTAALLADKLRGGAMADAIRLGELAPVANALRSHYAHSPRVQGLVTMFGQMRRLFGE